LVSAALPRQRRASVSTIERPSPVPARPPPAPPGAKRSNSFVSSPATSPGPLVEHRDAARVIIINRRDD